MVIMQNNRQRIKTTTDLVHKSPLGIMEPRKCGIPVRLTYFVAPYDLVDITTKEMINLSSDSKYATISEIGRSLSNYLQNNLHSIIPGDITEKNLGLSATVEIESSSPHKLQVSALLTIQQNSGLPVYAAFTTYNSEKLPAQFVLNLSQPLPMLNTSINQIINELVNEPATIKEYLTTIMAKSKESLVSLVARQELDLNKGPFCRSIDILRGAESDSCDLKKHVYSIKLLDQYHTYHVLDNYLERQDGAYLTKIPFTHPTSIPTILRILRQQALFNCLIGSCIRRSKNNNNIFNENSTPSNESNIFDIIPVSLNNLCISFEHPSKESLATLEIDLSKDLSCHLHVLDKESVCSDEFATQVLQKCWSIPVTLRSVLKKINAIRLALVAEENKRREREVQELMTNNSAQQGLQFKPHLQFQDTLLQNRFSGLNDKSNARDLNSIAEFLSSKINASTSDASNQTNVDVESASNRSNLLKKFSCKPKAKQNMTTKNQTGNKILSLMLKRQNSSVEPDPILKKKAKTAKSQACESSVKTSAGVITTTKLISTEAANAARLASKQAKHNAVNQNSLMVRSPSKSQQSVIPSSSNQMTVGLSLTSQNAASSSKQFESSIINSASVNPSNIRLKMQPNGNNNASKPRKSSIGAVLDRLVGGVTPEQNSSGHLAGTQPTDNSSDSVAKNAESSKGSPLGAKTKSRTPGDQFAIKQGSLGSLKLTVTKTKPATASSSSASTSSSTPVLSSSTTPSAGTPSSAKTDAAKILGLGSSTPNIKYTIPRISKSQQASQSGSNPTNSTEGQHSTNSDTNAQSDDSSNPSSSATSSAAPSSTTNKRTTSTPFNRTNNMNRNPVSSSTHPAGRTTSNPLANASRPSSTSASENHQLSRISSSNQNQSRQQINNRMVNLQQPAMSRLVNQNVVNIQQQQPQQLQPSSQPPVFALGLPQQPSPFQDPNDLNILAANQAALLSQQHNLNSLQQMTAPFMSSSVDANLISSSRPQFTAGVQQPTPVVATTNSIGANVCDSLQRPSSSVINAAPQFYIRQPMFDDANNAVSSTPRIANEASQSSFTSDRKVMDLNSQPPALQALPVSFQPRAAESQSTTTNNGMSSSSIPGLVAGVSGNQGVSSTSDSKNQNDGPSISTPSSPTECSQAEIVPPPPLIPIDSLDEPQPASPETDHPDDASDRLSIVDTNENVADSNSLAGTPKPSSVNSPMNAQDSNSATPSSSSRTFEAPAAISSNDNEQLNSAESCAPSNSNTPVVTTQSPLSQDASAD